MGFLIPLLLSACFLIAGAVPVDEQRVLALPRITFRDYVESDFDDLTTVLVDAFSPSAVFRYINPSYAQHKDYYWHCYRDLLKYKFSNETLDNIFIRTLTVAEMDPTGTSPPKERGVSFSYWKKNQEHSTRSKASPQHNLWDTFPMSTAANNVLSHTDGHTYNCSLQLGTNVTRADYVGSILLKAQKEIIDARFPDNFELKGLATHPDWDGHNFAAMHLNWGFNVADELELPIPLMGTPAGYPLYDRMGFDLLKNVSFPKLDGEEDEIWFAAMARENR